MITIFMKYNNLPPTRETKTFKLESSKLNNLPPTRETKMSKLESS